MAEAIVEILESRNLTVTAAQRRKILACTDLTVLRAWARIAATTPSTRTLLTPRRSPPARRAPPR